MRSKSLEEKRSSNEETDKDLKETVDAVKNEEIKNKEAKHQSEECSKEPSTSRRTSMISAVCREKRSLEEQLGNLARLSGELANLNKVLEELRNLTAAAEEKTRKQLEVKFFF